MGPKGGGAQQPASGNATTAASATAASGTSATASSATAAPPAASPLEQVLFEVKRTIVGQDVLLERMAVGLLSGGHLLVEGVPGLAKTLAVKSLAGAIGGQFQRIQFTPDLLPADLVGTRVYRQHTGEFETSLGPVFTNLLLADEINRAPAKVQSALLEVMQERQVTIGRETFHVPDPFLVMATQNPIESEGTYPLPEAQVDRFMMKVVVRYPTAVEENAIVDRALRPPEAPQAILSPEDLVRMRARVQDVYVDPAIVDYAVRLVTATRSPGTVGLGQLERYVTYGASPRASIALVLGARALAYLRGRDYVVPHDLRELAPDVLRHRVVLSYEALADDVDPDTVIAGVLKAVPMPEVPLRDR
ncbi:AAA family ATPase [Pseudofrankia sp. BMG5.37]